MSYRYSDEVIVLISYLVGAVVYALTNSLTALLSAVAVVTIFYLPFKRFKECLIVLTIVLILITPVIIVVDYIHSKNFNPLLVALAFTFPSLVLGLIILVEFRYSVKSARKLKDQKILKALKRIEEKLGVSVEVFVTRDDEVNAYVTGFKRFRVFITEKLLNVMDSDEVVGILAHEIAHCKKRHITKTLLTSVFLVVFGVILRLYLLQRIEPSIAISLTAVILIILDKVYLALMRKFKYEADLIGAEVVGVETMISALRKLEEKDIGKLSEIYSDHPSIKNRIKRLQARTTSSQ
jgi:STE24 endopeptidase